MFPVIHTYGSEDQLGVHAHKVLRLLPAATPYRNAIAVGLYGEDFGCCQLGCCGLQAGLVSEVA